MIRRGTKAIGIAGAALLAATVAISGPAIAGPKASTDFSGRASYYAKDYKGRTASGQQYDGEKFTAAHRSLPFGTTLRVTDPRSGRSVSVVVNDRGPFIKDRVLDLSLAAAKELKMLGRGIATVHAEVQDKAQ